MVQSTAKCGIRFKRRFQRIWNSFVASRLGIPLVAVFLLFTLSAVLLLVFEVSENEMFENFLDSFWWAIITFSTTGYGDKVPITPGGRIVAIISIFLGMGIIGALSGTMASIFVDRNTQARRGLMDLRRVKGHIIICGWKDHMSEILKEILRANEDFSSENVVIVSNIDAERIGELKEESDLKKLRFIRGDYFSESALDRANVKTARKVLVLADTLESRASSEVDSKTVITVLTIRAMDRDVYICVELLDRKYEHYLRQAMCDEIILIRDYSNLLLANTSSTSGISHIVQNLLDVTVSGVKLKTAEIPAEYIGRQYSKYREFVTSPRSLCLGIMENTGSPNRMKMMSLRDAQKTSDISRLISNLQEVKNLSVNQPVLHPDESYVIPNHSMGIVLEKVGVGGEKSDGK